MTLAAVPEAAKAIAFDVVDVLGGFASLVKRSPTLGGSVPVRVAQACVPLLEGNAWGFQVTLARPIAFRRRLAGWTAELADEPQRLLRATVPMLVADGTLAGDKTSPASGSMTRGTGDWQRRLERGIVDKLSVFTGLFVRPRDGVRIRQSSTANRRAVTYGIEPAILDDTSGWCPIVLTVVPAPGVDAFVLAGEIATLGALPARLSITRATLDEAPHIGRAHLGFYDAAYFETKKRGQIARKYRDELPRAAGDGTIRATVVDTGPVHVEVAPATRFHRARGIVREAGEPDRLVVRNAVALTAAFDGHTVTVTPDPGELATYAREVRTAWERWLGGPPPHPGALLYLTKYVTPHPPGEPHFFVKPPSLVETSPGVSTIIDGVGSELMRGVVRTDGFHATPAVFQLVAGRSIEVARGAPLVELFPCPRALIDADISRTTGGVRW